MSAICLGQLRRAWGEEAEGQAVAGQNFYGSPVPLSIAQMWIPRV